MGCGPIASCRTSSTARCRPADVMALRALACAGLRGRVLEIGFGSGLNADAYPPRGHARRRRRALRRRLADVGGAARGARRSRSSGSVSTASGSRPRTRRTTPCCRRSRSARSPTSTGRARRGTPGAATRRGVPLPRARPRPRPLAWRGGSAGSTRCSAGSPAAATSAATSRRWSGLRVCEVVALAAAYLPGPSGRHGRGPTCSTGRAQRLTAQRVNPTDDGPEWRGGRPGRLRFLRSAHDYARPSLGTPCAAPRRRDPLRRARRTGHRRAQARRATAKRCRGRAVHGRPPCPTPPAAGTSSPGRRAGGQRVDRVRRVDAARSRDQDLHGGAAPRP